MKKLIEGIVVRPSGGRASTTRLPIPGVSGTVIRASSGSSIVVEVEDGHVDSENLELKGLVREDPIHRGGDYERELARVRAEEGIETPRTLPPPPQRREAVYTFNIGDFIHLENAEPPYVSLSTIFIHQNL